MISWLARFHSEFFGKEPAGLWPDGSYWDLQRPHRLSALGNTDPCDELERDLIKYAADFDTKIRNCAFQTIIHGDAKVENFCFGKNGDCAGLDFQWVGRGPGVRDLMCLISSCVKSEEMIEKCVEIYFELLEGWFEVII